jgi:hypothetical protein
MVEEPRRIQVACACEGDRIDRLRGAFWMRATPYQTGIDGHLEIWNAERLDIVEETITERYARREQKPWPERDIDMATVNTVYIPLYRVHSKEHFLAGQQYPNNWQISERKKAAQERFSPAGVEGFYFGLTLEAAENEARHYGKGVIDETKMILVLLACFDRLLYLPICIQAIWCVLGFPKPDHPMEMLLATMDRSTNNEVANEIGKWARESGFAGILYPSARYDDVARLERLRAEGKTIIPELNFVYIGSHLCRNLLGFIAHSPIVDLYQHAKGVGETVRLRTEPDLVVFDGRRLMGDPCGVVYETFPLGDRLEAQHRDDPWRQVKPFVHTLDL